MGEIEKRGQQSVQNTAAERLNESGAAFSPDVDIYACDDEAVFFVDMPGVEKGDVGIEVDESDTLIIKAKNSIDEPKNAVLRQYTIGNYYRAFQISQDYDKEKIQAKLEDGLLEVRIPKREETKPRKITISA